MFIDNRGSRTALLKPLNYIIMKLCNFLKIFPTCIVKGAYLQQR